MLNLDFLKASSYAVLSGVFGTVILVLFLALFLDLQQLLATIPFVMAFNSAMTGFAFIDKTGLRSRSACLYSMGGGAVNVMLAFIILLLLSLHFLGETPFNGLHFLAYLFIGTGCSMLGSLLAVKYFSQKS